MGTVEGKKQEKRRALLEAAYDLFLERGAAKTSVEDITSRAKVAKGTFYLYFQDKGAVMQALLGRVSYQLLSDACEAVEKQTELENFPDKMVAVIDHIIEALRKDTLVLKFLEHNFIWPGLDQIEASREAEPLMRKLLNVVLKMCIRDSFTTTKITKALLITFKYAFITVPLKLVFALFIAYILNFKIACVNLFRLSLIHIWSRPE